MDDSAFALIEEAARSRDAEAVFERLAGIARRAEDYHLLFGARILGVRHRLKLPLIDNGELRLSDQERRIYEDAFRQAARESGELLLAAGHIPEAWQYFKAISEPAPVAAAIDRAEPAEELNRIIEIAYQEGVSRRRGFELCLKHHGICTAITWFGANPDPVTRQQCLELLVASLYKSVANAIKETVAATEAKDPATDSLAELMAGRDWLFEGISSYVDATHLTSILRFAPELRDLKALRMAVELADYGQRLNPMFHFRGDPPFEETYRDHAAYLRALIGENPDAQVEHFRQKIRGPGDSMPARTLVELLVRLGRYGEAIDAAAEFLPPAANRANLAVALELCQTAGDFRKLREFARDQGDLLGFAAGVVQDQTGE